MSLAYWILLGMSVWTGFVFVLGFYHGKVASLLEELEAERKLLESQNAGRADQSENDE
jgi:hypothetical protein